MTEYFGMLPLMKYNFSTTNTPNIKQVVDITRRTKVSEVIMKGSIYYDYYLVQNHETPEIIADRFYNSPTLHWLILMANDIVDVKTDWPLNEEVFEKYVADKYGVDNIYKTHHNVNSSGLISEAQYYKDVNGIATPDFGESVTPVSNYDYELLVNNKKRLIRLIKPNMVDAIVEQVETTIQQG